MCVCVRACGVRACGVRVRKRKGAEVRVWGEAVSAKELTIAVGVLRPRQRCLFALEQVAYWAQRSSSCVECVRKSVDLGQPCQVLEARPAVQCGHVRPAEDDGAC